jgi:molybdenum cofactor synthesis domain-containing protein
LREEQTAVMARSGRVVIASTRAAAGVYEDRTGPIIVDWLNQQGIATPAPVVVPDGQAVVDALSIAIGEGVDVIITSGGTGISPTDRTADATAEIVDYQIPGLADAIRRSGLPHVPTSVLSRGVCGVKGRTLIVNLPGSTGGVKDGLGVLDEVLEHALDQLSGKDHKR